MLEDIVIRLDGDFSNYLADIRENEDMRMENEKKRQDFFEELLKEKKMYYGRYRRFYISVDEEEDTFAVPDEYNAMSMLDVYVNGFYLNPKEYCIQDRNVVLTKPLDEAGTRVEIVVTRAIGIPTENFEELRGFSAYEVAIKNGFKGSVDDWIESLKGVGAYDKKSVFYTTTTKSEKRFQMPSDYELGDFKEVFVNGIKLTEDEFSVEFDGDGYVLILKNMLDVVGTMVEIDIIHSAISFEALTNEEIDELLK